MNRLKKILCMFSLFILSVSVYAADSISIIAPAQGAAVTGLPLSITGSSSQPNARIRLNINNTTIGSTSTDGSGNWSFSLNGLYAGSYALKADLITAQYELLATTTNSFTVLNTLIAITSPAESAVIAKNPVTITGNATLALTDVRLSLDSSQVATTTTDADGNWQTTCFINSNSAHTLLAELMVAGSAVATSTITVTGSMPVLLPSGIAQLRVVKGSIPTTGSGTGTGYTYSVTGNTITITFNPAFTVTPTMLLTGVYSSGSSTTTVASTSTAIADIVFSAGTEYVNFVALEFS